MKRYCEYNYFVAGFEFNNYRPDGKFGDDGLEWLVSIEFEDNGNIELFDEKIHD